MTLSEIQVTVEKNFKYRGILKHHFSLTHLGWFANCQ